VKYSIIVSNKGDADASGVKVLDQSVDEERADGMAAMSKAFDAQGGEVYVPRPDAK
jgi:hypothetical protein